MITISFLAQSPDNTSPDPMEVDGISLSPNNPQRQEITKLVSKVSLNGEKVEGNGFALYVLDSQYVIRAIPEGTDQIGRLAPILCYGVFPESPTDIWISELIEKFEVFAKKLNRSFPEGRIDDISNMLRREILDVGSKKKDYSPLFNNFILTSAKLYNLCTNRSSKVRRPK